MANANNVMGIIAIHVSLEGKTLCSKNLGLFDELSFIFCLCTCDE
jgi:hypothetical protein